MTSHLTKNRVPLFPLVLLCTLTLQIITLVIIAGQGFAIRALNNKQAPSLVQMNDGYAFRAKAVPADFRTDETIKAFVTGTLIQLFNWRGSLPVAEGEPLRDPGIDIETTAGSQKVTTASATASFALAEDFRLPFLQRVADLTPPGVFTGQTQVVLVIDAVSEPEELEPGKWQVTVLAHLNVFNSRNALQETIPFHRDIVVAVTTAPLVPEGETPLEQAIYAIRMAGLQITDIRPIDR